MTSVPGVFVAGDMGRGQSLIVWAIAEGRARGRRHHRLPALIKPTAAPHEALIGAARGASHLDCKRGTAAFPRGPTSHPRRLCTRPTHKTSHSSHTIKTSYVLPARLRGFADAAISNDQNRALR